MKTLNTMEVCEECEHEEHIQDFASLLSHPEILEQATKILSALSDKTRFKILAALSISDLCVCELEEICEISQSGVSHQLRILKDSCLVTSRREGLRVVYSLSDSHVQILIDQALQHAQHTLKEA